MPRIEDAGDICLRRQRLTQDCRADDDAGVIEKGKAIPLQAWARPEGSRRLRLPDFEIIGTWRW